MYCLAFTPAGISQENEHKKVNLFKVKMCWVFTSPQNNNNNKKANIITQVS